MKQTTKRFLSMILGVVFFVGSVVTYFQFIQPEYGEILKLKSTMASLQSFLDKEKQAINTVKQLISDYNTKNEKIQQTVSLVLPTEPDVAGAVAQLYGLSQNNNLQLKSVGISVSGLSNAPSQVTGLAPSNLALALQRPKGTLSLSTVLTGSYEDFKAFLSELQTNIRIFDIKSLAVSPIINVNNKVPQPIERFTFSISVATYYQSP